MGYTHYFPRTRNFTEEEWNLITDAVQRIFDYEETAQLIAADYDLPEALPVCDEAAIEFNGIAESGHEKFVLLRDNPLQGVEPHPYGFNFCKTARKPYDVVVVAVLCAVQAIAPGVLTISSDGESRDWTDGLMLAREVLGPSQIEIPFRVYSFRKRVMARRLQLPYVEVYGS